MPTLPSRISPEPRNSWGRRWGAAKSRLYGSLPFSLSSLTIVDLCTRMHLPM